MNNKKVVASQSFKTAIMEIRLPQTARGVWGRSPPQFKSSEIINLNFQNFVINNSLERATQSCTVGFEWIIYQIQKNENINVTAPKSVTE